MKKSKIAVAVFAVVIAAASAAKAEDVRVDFDNTGGKSPDTYITENIGVENNKTGQRGVGRQEELSALSYEAKVPAIGEILRDIPIGNRLKFLNSLVLRNGRIIYGDAGPLKKTLGQSAADEIVKALSSVSFPGADQDPGIPARVVQLSLLLSEVPANIREEFLVCVAKT